MSPGLIVLTVCGVGFVITHRIAAHHWYAQFGVEFEGFCWALLGAALWPIIGPLWLAYQLVDGRKTAGR